MQILSVDVLRLGESDQVGETFSEQTVIGVAVHQIAGQSGDTADQVVLAGAGHLPSVDAVVGSPEPLFDEGVHGTVQLGQGAGVSRVSGGVQDVGDRGCAVEQRCGVGMRRDRFAGHLLDQAVDQAPATDTAAGALDVEQCDTGGPFCQ